MTWRKRAREAAVKAQEADEARRFDSEASMSENPAGLLSKEERDRMAGAVIVEDPVSVLFNFTNRLLAHADAMDTLVAAERERREKAEAEAARYREMLERILDLDEASERVIKEIRAVLEAKP